VPRKRKVSFEDSQRSKVDARLNTILFGEMDRSSFQEDTLTAFLALPSESEQAVVPRCAASNQTFGRLIGKISSRAFSRRRMRLQRVTECTLAMFCHILEIDKIEYGKRQYDSKVELASVP